VSLTVILDALGINPEGRAIEFFEAILLFEFFLTNL